MGGGHFVSKRVSRTSTIAIDASPDEAFVLFGPIVEQRWAAEWRPTVLYGEGDPIEERMVFLTASHHDDGRAVWIVSRYEPEHHLIEYTVYTPDRVWWITIRCRLAGSGGATTAEITYTYNGLTERGNALIGAELDAMYSENLRNWQRAINRYVETGEASSLHDGA